MNVYLDEAGFSGNYLSDKNSPLFVFASVAMPAAEADECVERVVRDFRIQGGELKGKNLTKTAAGRKAISRLLTECLTHSSSVVFDKTFALCCKLFEYIFEPVIADKSSLFYDIGFHKFVAHWLYVELIATGEGLASDLLLDFERMMRQQDVAGMKKLFGVSAASGVASRISEQILDFALAHRDTVLGELESVRSVGAVGNWVLDLSDTAITALLCHWGEEFHELDVYCDRSKPLEALRLAFDCMVGRKDKTYITMGGKTELLTYNLVRPIQFVDSANHKGVQLADVIASVLLYALRHRDDPECVDWLRRFDASHAINPQCNLPDMQCVDFDLRRPEGVTNSTVFIELMERTKSGRDVLDRMEEFIMVTVKNAPAYCAWRESQEGAQRE
ncbi:MAG TPA: DUF3800 domain-containing protein [Candidatus Sulfotelmatobacter sp.]|nr:DUF3800 domain-containing protein [Candidatus Sulfotelmatobacter sp.]